MTEQNKAVEALEAAASALPVLATLLGHAKLEQGQQRANETLKLVQAALSRPTQTADAVEFIRKQADEFLPDMDTKSLDARHVSLMAAIRNGVNYGAALSRTATSEVEPVGLRDAANGLLHFFPLEEGENERGCRFGDAVADLRDALSSTPTPTHDSGLAGEAEDLKVLDDAWRLIQMTWLNMRLLGLKDRGDDVSLKHELRMMALAFSKDAQGQGSFKKGNGQMLQVMDGLKKLRATLTAPQSNSDSELLRALSREVIATCKTEYGMLPEDLLARLEQGAA